jgi:tRNA 2-thiouridine synthesizing protein A
MAGAMFLRNINTSAYLDVFDANRSFAPFRSGKTLVILGGLSRARTLHYPYGLAILIHCGDRRVRCPLEESNAVRRAKAVKTQETTMEFNKEFDASGLACPMPIVKTKKALADMASGQILRVVATDPGSVCDMAAFAEQTGNALLEQVSENSKFVFYLKKA